jgi:hypothetical protein
MAMLLKPARTLRIGTRVWAEGRFWKVKEVDRPKGLALLTRKYLDNSFGPSYSQVFPVRSVRATGRVGKARR